MDRDDESFEQIKEYPDMAEIARTRPRLHRRNRPVDLNRNQAMAHLSEIVGTSRLRQDIRRIKNAQSLRGARKWAAKHSREGNEYTADYEDIDKDGIADVIVKDVNGDLVIVNGYTVRKSDYPYRQEFDELPDDVRKKHKNYRTYLTNEVYGVPKRDPETGQIAWKQNPLEDPRYLKRQAGGFRTFKPREQTTYQLFTSTIVKPQIKELFESDPEKYKIGVDDAGRPKFPNVLLTLAADAWNYGVLKPIFEREYGVRIPNDVSSVDLKRILSDPVLVKIKKRSDFKEKARSLVVTYLEEDYENNGEFLEYYLKPLNARILGLADSLAEQAKRVL